MAGTITVEASKPATQADKRKVASTAAPMSSQTGRSRPKGVGERAEQREGHHDEGDQRQGEGVADEAERVQRMEMIGPEGRRR